jgi:hypothetical protein
MSPEAGAHGLLGDLVAESVALIEAFRRRCVAAGYAEQLRVGLARHHDASVRFTNSTISVLKEHLDTPLAARLFLVQPAIRLRNLTHWLEHGRMSGFGCYFVALGTLCSPDRMTEVHREVVALLIDDFGVPPNRMLLRSSSADADLCQAASGCGLPVEIDGYAAARYCHVFGIDGVTGRNTNVAIVTDAGPVDVANVIIIERAGRPIAVEAAYGVNMVLAQRECLAHPVLASVGAVALARGVSSLVTLDALGSAVGLVTEGLSPVSRGRGGKLRLFLKLLATDEALSGELRDAVGDVVEADQRIRRHVSPPVPELFDEHTADDVVERVLEGIARLAVKQ